MFLTFDLIEVKLQDRIVLPNVFFRDVNEEFQMYFIAYERQSPAIGHLTKQDRNPNIFENNSDLLKLGFFFYMFYLYVFLWEAESHFL